MTSSQIAEKNVRSALLIDSFYERLRSDITDEIDGIKLAQNQADAKQPSDFRVEFHEPLERCGQFGAKLWQCESSLARLKLYVNNPIRWIDGEILKHSPFGDRRKYFAVNVDQEYGETVTCTIMGCYDLHWELGWNARLESLGLAIVADLALGSVEEADLEHWQRVAADQANGASETCHIKSDERIYRAIERD